MKMGGDAERRRSLILFACTLSCVRYLTICSPWLGHQLGASRGHFGQNKKVPTCYNAQVEGFEAVYKDAKDPWSGGSLDHYDRAMEWNC
jgi:hypothetical protein